MNADWRLVKTYRSITTYEVVPLILEIANHLLKCGHSLLRGVGLRSTLHNGDYTRD
jgi:hypothetical protein